MAHPQQQDFCNRMRAKYGLYFDNCKVLDIGSYDVNGNNRYLFGENTTYTGLDLTEGPNVDIIRPAHLFSPPDASYGFIISTEVFEHDLYWRESIQNIIRMLKPNGAFLFTCASTGRQEHGTRRTDVNYSAPPLLAMHEEWQDYYKNLDENDIRSVDGFNDAFLFCEFEYNNSPGDLYFFGVKKSEQNN